MAQLNFRYRTGKAAYALDHLSWIRVGIEDADPDSGAKNDEKKCSTLFKKNFLIFFIKFEKSQKTNKN